MLSKKLMAASVKDREYLIDQSTRFDKPGNPYLERTQIQGDEQVFTVSFWLKRGSQVSGTIFEASNLISFTDRDNVSINLLNQTISAGALKRVSGTVIYNHTVITQSTLSDPSGWYHIVIAFDLTDATATDRIKVYFDNELQVFTTNSVGTEAISINRAGVPFYIGRLGDAATNHYDGYLAEIHFIDGEVLTPVEFGESDADSGQWVPKEYTGSYGNNGFYLDFADASNLGKDVSSNLPTSEEVIYENNMETAIPTFTTPSWFSQSTTKAKSGTHSMRVAISSAGGNATASLGDTFYAEEGGEISLWWNTDNIDDDDAVVGFYTLNSTNGFIGVDLKRQNQSDIYYYKPTSTTTQNLLPTGVVPQNNVWFKFEYVFDSINYVFSIYNESGTVLFTETGPHYRQSYTHMYISDADGQWRYYIDDIAVKQRNAQFVVRNLTVDDQMLDTPTNNFSVLNPADPNTTATLSEGNLKTVTPGSGGVYAAYGTIGVSSGKWYIETTLNEFSYSGNGQAGGSGLINSSDRINLVGAYFSAGSSAWVVRAGTGTTSNLALTGSAVGMVMNIAIDLDAGRVWIGKNGVWNGSGNPDTEANPDGTFTPSGTYRAYAEPYRDGVGYWWLTANYGADSSFAGIKIRQGNADENNEGDFYYTPPTGFLALCENNLPVS